MSTKAHTPLTDKQSQLLTGLFIRWTNTECDIETLQLGLGTIQNRLAILNKIIDTNNRVVVKGFNNQNTQP